MDFRVFFEEDIPPILMFEHFLEIGIELDRDIDADIIDFPFCVKLFILFVLPDPLMQFFKS